MNTAAQDSFLAEMILDGLQVNFPEVVGYDLLATDGHWVAILHYLDGDQEKSRETESHLSVFCAAEQAARQFLATQVAPEWHSLTPQ